MKHDPANFEYDSSAGAATRVNCRMVPFGSQYTQQGSLDGYQYRSNSLSTYPYPQKPYYPPPSYGEFPDGNVEYELETSQMQLMGVENLGMPSSYSASIGRVWTPAPQAPKSSPFLDQPEGSYNHGHLPYHGSSYSKSLSSNGMNSSLPAPIPGNDRLLPYPATNRPTPSFLRSSGSQLAAPPPGFSYNGMMNTPNMISGIKNSNSNSISESGTLLNGYLPMPCTSPQSLSSSHMVYSSQPLSINSQESEIYTPPSNDGGGSGGLFPNAEPAEESSYAHTRERSKRGSESSQTTNSDGSMAPVSSHGTLANGHEYHRYNPQPTYQPPPMEMPLPLRHDSQTIQHNNSIAATS